MISLAMGVYGVYCRTFQCAIKAADYFMGYRMPEYIFGRGFLERLPQLLKEKDAGKVLFVTDPGLVKLDMIKDEHVDQIIAWAKKEANPLYPVPILWGNKEFREFIDSVRVK